MGKRLLVSLVLIGTLACLLGLAAYNLPPIHERLSWRVANLRTQIRYAINPPEEAVFVPQEGQQELMESIVQATLRALTPTVTPTSAPTNTLQATQPGPTPTASPSPVPTLTPTPIPEQVSLSGITHEYQQMNNCGPTTLAMALSFWGWEGDQRDTRAYLRPNFSQFDDKNVSPYEMVSFVETQTGLKALSRVGGDLQMLKRFLAAGFPVIIEKGFQPPKEDWMGHYEALSGYDDARERFTAQDSYIMADFPVPYQDLSQRWWRDFNYIYVVLYPPDQEAQVMDILGPHAETAWDYQAAAEKALAETASLQGRDLFFAWYNRGTNLAAMGDYIGAAGAYDQAFALYGSIPERERPWRMLWYQVGPYQAYYHSGRYQDVINLADQTLTFLSAPVLEETYYWRGLARESLGDLEGAIRDLRQAAEINPTSTDVLEQLRRLDVEAP
jgi:hypothetical protein